MTMGHKCFRGCGQPTGERRRTVLNVQWLVSGSQQPSDPRHANNTKLYRKTGTTRCHLPPLPPLRKPAAAPPPHGTPHAPTAAFHTLPPLPHTVGTPDPQLPPPPQVGCPGQTQAIPLPQTPAADRAQCQTFTFGTVGDWTQKTQPPVQDQLYRRWTAFWGSFNHPGPWAPSSTDGRQPQPTKTAHLAGPTNLVDRAGQPDY